MSDIPLPNADERKALFNINLKEVKVDEDVNVEEIATKCEGYLTSVNYATWFFDHEQLQWSRYHQYL